MNVRIPMLLVMACGPLLTSAVPAVAQTAGEMLLSCQILQHAMQIERGKVYFPVDRDTMKCWGFMQAVSQYATIADQQGRTLLNACPAAETPIPKIVSLFVAYVKAHPEKRDLMAAAAAYNAMADAFPCEGPPG